MKSLKHARGGKASITALAAALMLAACGGGGDPSTDAPQTGESDQGSVVKVAGTVSGLTAQGLVLSNGTDLVTVPANATSFSLPAGGTLAVAHQPVGFTQACEVGGSASSPTISCAQAVAKVSWVAGWGGTLQSNAPAVMGPDGRMYFISNNAVYSALPSGEGGYRWLAGSPMEQGVADGPGEAARFSGPQGMVADADGNLYVLDTRSGYAIRKVTPAGVVSTLASGLVADGVSLSHMALGPNAQIYLLSAEPDATSSVRRLTAQGQLEVVFNTNAMTGMANFAPNLTGMAVGSNGTVYLADSQNKTIYKLPLGATTLEVLAGSGTGEGCSNTGCADGLGQNARINNVQGLVVDSQGVLYAIDHDGTLLRRISPSGEVKTIVGDPTVAPNLGNADGTGASASMYAFRLSLSLDGSALYLGTFEPANIRVVRNLSADGADVSTVLTSSALLAQPPSSAKSALLEQAAVVASDAAGNVYVNETRFAPSTFQPQGSYIRKISPQGTVSTVGATATTLNGQFGSLKVGPDGQLYAAGPCSIERMSMDGSLSTLVGAPGQTNCGAASIDGPAGTGTVSSIVGMAPSVSGRVFFSEFPNLKMRMLDTDGSITTLSLVDSQGAPFTQQPFVVGSDGQGQLYLLTGTQVYKMTVQGSQATVTWVAGGDEPGYQDGDAQTARFNGVYGMSADSAGNLYVLHIGGSSATYLRQITPAGQVKTLAGGGANGENRVDGVGDAVRFQANGLASITTTPSGEVYVVDGGFLRQVVPVKDTRQ